MRVYGLMNASSALKSGYVCWNVVITEMMACLILMTQDINSATMGLWLIL